MELGQPETLPALDRHQCGRRHVDAHLDHRRADQDLDPAAAEVVHHGILLGRAHPPVDQPQPEGLQLAVGQLLVGLFQAGDRRLVRLLDQRRDHVSLAAFAELLAEELPPLRPLLLGGQIRVHLLPARRAVGQRRDVQVAEERHGHGPRDGRGGHHEVMGIGAGVFEHRPLADAELVLLVDHHQGELGELDVVLDHRLRAHHHVQLPGRDLLQDPAPLFGSESADQLRPADVAAGQQLFQREGVLPGEDFGGGHQHGLVSVGDRQQHGVDGHDRLAAAHVALQQPVHRQRGGHVAGDFSDRLLLPGGQLEGEQPPDACIDSGGGLQRWGPLLVVLLPALHGQPQLQNEQLLVDEPPPRPRQVIPTAWEMDLRQGPPERPEIVALEILGRKHFVEQPGVRVQHATDDLAELPLLDTFGGRIDGQDLPGGLLFVFGECFDAGMAHLPNQPSVFRLAREHQPLAERELLLHVGLIEPECAEVSGSAADQHPEHAAAAAGSSQIDLFDHAADGLQLALFELVDFPPVGQVLVIAGEEEEHVAGGVQAEPLEHLAGVRPHALEALHRRGQQLGGGFLGTVHVAHSTSGRRVRG